MPTGSDLSSGHTHLQVESDGSKTVHTEQDLQEQEYSFPYHYVAQFGEQFRGYFLDTWAINYASTMEFMLGRLRGHSGSRIVDIGCGDGRFSREMALSLPSAEVAGIDYSPRAINLAAAMNPDVANLRFLALDISTPTGLEPFDVAVLMEVFEHIPLPDAAGFMASVRRLLATGGLLYLTVPHKNKPLEYKHFQHFSIETLSAYLRPHFDIVEIIPFERMAITRRLLEKVLSNRFFILNNGRMLNLIYRWYKSNLFPCSSETSCQRLFALARAK